MSAVIDPFGAGVEPWQMLGYLQGALEASGTITPEVWLEAIESQTLRAISPSDPRAER